MKITYVIPIFIALAIVGCGTTKLSPSERKAIDDGEKVMLSTSNMPIALEIIFFFLDFPDIYIRKVDGKDVSEDFLNSDNEVAVEPGTHDLKLHCSGRKNGVRVSYSEIVKIEARKGYRYKVSGGMNSDNSCFFEIREIALKS